MKKKYLYLAVTNDELELPLVVESKAKDLAIKLNINYNGLRASISQGCTSRTGKYKCIKVEI